MSVFIHIVHMFEDAIAKYKDEVSYMKGEEMTSSQESIIVYMGDEVVPRCSEKGNMICGLVQKRSPNSFTCSPSRITENNLDQVENFKIG